MLSALVRYVGVPPGDCRVVHEWYAVVRAAPDGRTAWRNLKRLSGIGSVERDEARADASAHRDTAISRLRESCIHRRSAISHRIAVIRRETGRRVQGARRIPDLPPES